jgi:hypothetical protein
MFDVHPLFYENPSLVKRPWLFLDFAAVPFFYPSVPPMRLAHVGGSKRSAAAALSPIEH